MTRYKPYWELGPVPSQSQSTHYSDENPVTSFGQLVELMALEAVERLLLGPMDKWTEQEFDYLAERLDSAEEANGVVCFDHEIRTEAIRVAVRIGFALARTDHGLSDYEQWLQDAISTAGLSGYQPRVEWGTPTRGDVQP